MIAKEKWKAIAKDYAFIVAGTFFLAVAINGPGEAREADIGIAGGKGEAVLFIHGQPIKKLTGDNILDQFMDEIYKI